MTKFKNRIIGSGEEPLDQIMFNPRNWRVYINLVCIGIFQTSTFLWHVWQRVIKHDRTTINQF